MAEHPAIVLVQRMTYRGVNEEFSNKYHFSAPSAPTTPADWKTLVDAVAAQVKVVFPSSVAIVRAYCYTDGSADSVATIDYTALAAEINGTLSTTGGERCPGDDAVWIRWATTKKNSRGKSIYLRKYYHPAYKFQGGDADAVLTAQKTALTTLGGALKDGTHAAFVLCGPDGTAAGAVAVSQNVTTRTLKRRGKRPPT